MRKNMMFYILIMVFSLNWAVEKPSFMYDFQSKQVLGNDYLSEFFFIKLLPQMPEFAEKVRSLTINEKKDGFLWNAKSALIALNDRDFSRFESSLTKLKSSTIESLNTLGYIEELKEALLGKGIFTRIFWVGGEFLGQESQKIYRNVPEQVFVTIDFKDNSSLVDEIPYEFSKIYGKTDSSITVHYQAQAVFMQFDDNDESLSIKLSGNHYVTYSKYGNADVINEPFSKLHYPPKAERYQQKKVFNEKISVNDLRDFYVLYSRVPSPISLPDDISTAFENFTRDVQLIRESLNAG